MQTGSRHIEGYACVFSERSLLMRDWEKGLVYEQVEPGAITEETLRSSDVVAAIEHDETRMLARSVNGDGSLSLSLDDHGLKFGFYLPDTSEGNIVLEGVKRKDYRGMSFGFWIIPKEDVSYTTEQDGDKTITVRHINRIRGIFDVSIVAHPAYPSTDVEVRSLKQELDAAFSTVSDKETRSEAMKRDYDKLTKFIKQNINRR